jgi:hypothetical protein
MFDIIPLKGEKYTVNRRHDLALMCTGYDEIKKGTVEIISVDAYLSKPSEWKQHFKLYRSAGVTCWDRKDVDVDPYEYGASLSLSSDDNTILQDYKINDRNTRLQVLAGVIDKEGTLLTIDQDNRYQIILKSDQVRNDVMFIARSLGFSAHKINSQTLSYYGCFIYGCGIEEIPCRLSSNQMTDNLTRNKDNLVTEFTVNSVGEGEYYGFSLDKNRLFLLESFDVCRNTGKSTIVNDIVASKSHIACCAQIFSGTEDSNHAYSEKFPPCCVFSKLDMKAVKNFAIRQKIAKQFLPNPWAIQIIDDCTDDPKIFRDPIFHAYYKNGRHWNMVHILSLQYALDIPPAIRNSIDFTFILRETNQNSREILWKNYAGCIPNYQMFQDIMDTVTEDYTALVINNRVQSNKIEDCIFWYKAKPDRLPPNWKFGHPVSWEHNTVRYDPSKQGIIIA